MSRVFSFVNRNKYSLMVVAGGVAWGGVVLSAYDPRYSESYLDKHNRVNKKSGESNSIEYFKENHLPSRSSNLDKLRSLTKNIQNEELDVIVIGGGATGAGVTLDAITRGMSVAMFERDDFCSQTSSRSTKLIHGGIRYLESAIMNLDIDDLHLVKEALSERSNLLNNAPHLSSPLPIAIPIYSWIDLPKMWIGTKLYDYFYPGRDVPTSYYQSASETLKQFPYLKSGLLGSVVYYDGQHNDARMGLAITLSAAQRGAITMNYTEVVGFLKEGDQIGTEEEPKIKGVLVRDRITGEVFKVRAKCVVNATGPFSDSIRKMDDPHAESVIAGASGVHLILPANLCPPHVGFLNPKTKDGRILFVLPFEGKTIAGTTDQKSAITTQPSPTKQEIDFILDALNQYTNDSMVVTEKDILSAWTGIRPLVKKASKESGPTSRINRSHSILLSASGLVTIVGGKWTTYRSMAEETVDQVVKQTKIFTPKDCNTASLMLYGGDKYYNELDNYLIKNFNIEKDIATHLIHSYGDQSIALLQMSKSLGLTNRLVEGYPYIEGEVIYGVKEYACTAEDILARRTRLAFLDNKKSIEALPKVVELMAPLMGWNKSTKDKQLKDTLQFLKTMTTPVNQSSS